jgi:toxin HigB-1
VIRTFACKKTEQLWQGKAGPAFRAFQAKAERKLAMLHAARALNDLALPGTRLEALQGKRKGQYSIRINDQWRLCFRWEAPHADDVEIVDYH